MLPQLFLKKNEERRLLAGHLWVFSNEIDNKQSPLKNFSAGQHVNVCRQDGRILGSAYVNPHSLISARIYSARANQILDQVFIQEKLQAALDLRESLYPTAFYRLCHSEGDFLPGLVVDRFGDYFSVQLNTFAMDGLRDEVIEALQSIVACKGIVLRNDSSLRELEGLPLTSEVVFGDIPETIEMQLPGQLFNVDLLSGQKTGWFYDQAENRRLMQAYVKSRSVLDVFSYSGSWTVAALAAGATQVTAVDRSAAALTTLEQNIALNAYSDQVSCIQSDAMQAIRQLKQEQAQYDVVIVDPPAFIKRKKDHKKGLGAYYDLNHSAMQLVKPGGIFISASCSFHLSASELQRSLLKAAQRLQRPLQILHQGQAGPDHPVHPAIAETNYLKAYFCRLL